MKDSMDIRRIKSELRELKEEREQEVCVNPERDRRIAYLIGYLDGAKGREVGNREVEVSGG